MIFKFELNKETIPNTTKKLKLFFKTINPM